MKIVRDAKGRYSKGYIRHRLPKSSRYEVDAETGCWNWLGALNKGYGRCKSGNKTIGAHRYFYEMFKGNIPAGRHIDHLCRNRSCVNPDHLEAVTPGENARRGDATKLTLEEAREIKRVMLDMCKKYGVVPRTLCVIAEGTTWKDA